MPQSAHRTAARPPASSPPTATAQRRDLVGASARLADPLQRKASLDAGRAGLAEARAGMAPNRTGLPDRLKSGVEALSGISLDDVRVSYGSSQPAQLRAEAFARSSAIHLAPGKEHHLPHEPWHVVQQKQGRVAATTQFAGTPVNDDPALEHEADVMGARALALAPTVQRAARTVTGGGKVAQAAYGAARPSGWGTYVDKMIYPNSDLSGSKPSVYPAGWPITIDGNSTQDEVDVYNWVRKYVVRGHLLNENLGGPGDDLRNLTPLVKSTNSTHSARVESKVKALVEADRAVHYRVEAMYGTPASAADMGAPNTQAARDTIVDWAGEIKADWTPWIWDPVNKSWSKDHANNPIGDLYIKNEGTALKGTYI